MSAEFLFREKGRPMVANVLVAIIVCLGLTGPICAQSGGQDAAIDPTVAVNIRDLDNKSAKTRRDAAINLHNMGAKASAAAPALLSKLATESHREMRPFIVAAIGLTGAQSPAAVAPRFCQVVATTTDRLGLEERLLFVRHTSPVTNAETP